MPERLKPRIFPLDESEVEKEQRLRLAELEAENARMKEELEILKSKWFEKLANATLVHLANNLGVERDNLQQQLTETKERAQNMEVALRKLLDTMEMQEKRESGEFHIPQDVALGLWSDAKAEARSAIDALEQSVERLEEPQP